MNHYNNHQVAMEYDEESISHLCQDIGNTSFDTSTQYDEVLSSTSNYEGDDYDDSVSFTNTKSSDENQSQLTPSIDQQTLSISSQQISTNLNKTNLNKTNNKTNKIITNKKTKSIKRQYNKLISPQEMILIRNIKRRKYFLPRVLKRDIRRFIGYMIANVINNADKDIIYAFHETYSIPHCELYKYCPMMMKTYHHTNDNLLDLPSNHNNLINKTHNIPNNNICTTLMNDWQTQLTNGNHICSFQQGIENVSRFCYLSSQLSPDIVYEILSYQIIPNNFTKDSQIFLKIRLSGSILTNSSLVCPSCNCIHTSQWKCSDPFVDMMNSMFVTKQCHTNTYHGNRFILDYQKILTINEDNLIYKYALYPLSLSITTSNTMM